MCASFSVSNLITIVVQSVMLHCMLMKSCARKKYHRNNRTVWCVVIWCQNISLPKLQKVRDGWILLEWPFSLSQITVFTKSTYISYYSTPCGFIFTGMRTKARQQETSIRLRRMDSHKKMGKTKNVSRKTNCLICIASVVRSTRKWSRRVQSEQQEP